MVIEKRLYSAEMFDNYAQRPENTGRRLELVGGEIIEVVSNNYASMIAAAILLEIGLHVKRGRLGYVTGADGGYIVAGERYIPDVGFISRQRQPEPCHDTWNPQAPDLAVEVLSPTDEERTLRIKVSNYLAAGTVVWVVDPNARTIEIHTPGQPVQVLIESDTLTAEGLFPGFALKLAEVFEQAA